MGRVSFRSFFFLDNRICSRITHIKMGCLQVSGSAIGQFSVLICSPLSQALVGWPIEPHFTSLSSQAEREKEIGRRGERGGGRLQSIARKYRFRCDAPHLIRTPETENDEIMAIISDPRLAPRAKSYCKNFFPDSTCFAPPLLEGSRETRRAVRTGETTVLRSTKRRSA